MCEYCAENDNQSNRNGWLNITRSANESIASTLFQGNAVLDDLLRTVDSQLPFNPHAKKNSAYDSYFHTPKSVSRRTGFLSGAYRRIKDVQAIESANFHLWTNSFVT